ncbi:ADP-ribosylglycohydrolase family protein [Oceanotoga sp. DSM 15011]|jgi:ADP-ribosylglycohydrolase|uniref:ADP-ribosylglycohydrolase n=1 Tax=Oceanotoga teriensis TaxID=515440 RepID=A0AA45C5H9_9BACT|nr:MULTISPECIES: ADP-ribosylglycohydrolase family protein [Oceanotoga]PWJ89020.1 ADP-ribosylglycohydrolase [Oceanotoga teriensis]UYP01384.1 ADP-ribosylglycohydrolase family protein [Oceanotoga sp. DSM 15011]
MKLFEKVLQAFAAGDAIGMPTEFMTRNHIKHFLKEDEDFIDPAKSILHKNLFRFQITDDTEQVLYLIKRYSKDGEITIKNTYETLEEWIIKSDAVKKGYIGPNSLKALENIKNGVPVNESGKNGTTCGAAMRVLAPSLCVKKEDEKSLIKGIINCSIPTHNTSLALEGAMGLGFAYHYLACNYPLEEVMKKIKLGCNIGKQSSNYEVAGASSLERIKFIEKYIKSIKEDEELLDFLYNVIGTGLGTNEVFPSAIGIFLYCRENVFKAIKLSSRLGGDTDTIGAISGGLCSLYSKDHNIPYRYINEISTLNNIDFDEYSNMISTMFTV